MKGLITTFLLVLGGLLLFMGVPLAGVPAEELFSLLRHYHGTIVRTVGFAALVGMVSMMFAGGALFAWVSTPHRFRRLVLTVLALPMIFPAYIAAFSYLSLLRTPWGLDFFGNTDTMQLAQAVGILALFLYPYPFLLLANRFARIDPSERAILSLYTSRLMDRIRSLYVPHLAGAGINGFLFVFLYVLSDFGAVSLLRIDTVTTELYQTVVRRFDFQEGAILAMVLLVIAAVSLGFRQIILPHGAISQRFGRYSPQRSFGRRGTAVLLILAFFTSGFVIPCATILSWYFRYLMDDTVQKTIWSASSGFSVATATSLGIAVATGGIISAVALFVLSYTRMGYARRMGAWVTRASILYYSLPAIVIAFSLMMLKYAIPGARHLGVAWLIAGYLVRFVGIGFLTILPAVEAIPDRFCRIGKTYLRGFLASVRHIFYPHVRAYVFQSFHMIYFHAIRELTIPLILLPLGFHVLSVRIWQTASEGLYVYASPGILLLLALSLPSFLWYIRGQSDETSSQKPRI